MNGPFPSILQRLDVALEALTTFLFGPADPAEGRPTLLAKVLAFGGFALVIALLWFVGRTP